MIFLFRREREIQLISGQPGVGALTLHGIKNLCKIYSWAFMFIVGPSCPVFLRICGSAFSDSTCLGSCSTVVFTTGEKIHVWVDSRSSNLCRSRLNIGLVPRRLDELQTPNTNFYYPFSQIVLPLLKVTSLPYLKLKKHCHLAFFCSKLNIFLSVVLFHHWGLLYSVYATKKKVWVFEKYEYLKRETKIV